MLLICVRPKDVFENGTKVPFCPSRRNIPAIHKTVQKYRFQQMIGILIYVQYIHIPRGTQEKAIKCCFLTYCLKIKLLSPFTIWETKLRPIFPLFLTFYNTNSQTKQIEGST